MTIGGKGVIMRGMLRVILNECEGSIPVVRRSVRRYSKHSKGSAAIMRKTLNVILNEREGSAIVVRKPIGSLPPFGSLGTFFTPSVNDMV
jgi:hypothetical protein